MFWFSKGGLFISMPEAKNSNKLILKIFAKCKLVRFFDNIFLSKEKREKRKKAKIAFKGFA